MQCYIHIKLYDQNLWKNLKNVIYQVLDKTTYCTFRFFFFFYLKTIVRFSNKKNIFTGIRKQPRQTFKYTRCLNFYLNWKFSKSNGRLFWLLSSNRFGFRKLQNRWICIVSQDVSPCFVFFLFYSWSRDTISTIFLL